MRVPRSAGIMPQLLLVRGVDGRQAEAGGEHAVEGGRRAAALDVAEHGGAGLEARARLDLALEPLPDAAEARVPELVRRRPRRTSIVPSFGSGALGHDDDREVAPARVPAADQPADLLDVERPLGDEDHVGAAGEARSGGRSSPRAGPSPPRSSRGCATRRWCAGGRSRRSRSARRCRSRTSCRSRRGRCRSSSARRAPAGRARRGGAPPRRACPRRRSRSARRG